MRIISGKYKGRRLGNKKFNARPTTDFAREGLFDILNNYFDYEQMKVLDLFSGTGSISYEFASRGCPHVELVESDFKNFKFITEIIDELGLKEVKPIKADVYRFIDKCKSTYDFIFADPPYDMKDIDQIPNLIFEKPLLNAEGWFVLEHSKQYKFSEHPHFKEQRNYGAVHFSIFR